MLRGERVQLKISILGHFGEGKTLLNGQTVKTKIITDELKKEFGNNKVLKIDTSGGLKTVFKAPFQALSALKKSENTVIFPAQNGLRIYAPLLAFFKGFFKKRRLHYVVIGGWLPEFLTENKLLKASLKKFDGIYVETQTMKTALEKQGFNNIFLMPNCKKLTVLSENELVYPKGTPLKLCTFSRVMKEKGIENAVDAVKKVNDQLGYTALVLDIYGQVMEESSEWFANLKAKFPEYVRYCGSVDADKSVEVLQEYFALLFPTHFYTEGIPGTIIDAYSAGIPVISAKWESFSDVVDNYKTGLGYDFDNEEQLENILLQVVQDPKVLLEMKENCLKKAKEFLPETAIKIIAENFAGGVSSVIN